MGHEEDLLRTVWGLLLSYPGMLLFGSATSNISKEETSTRGHLRYQPCPWLNFGCACDQTASPLHYDIFTVIPCITYRHPPFFHDKLHCIFVCIVFLSESYCTCLSVLSIYHAAITFVYVLASSIE
jgi:hypothetical protein